MKHKVKVIVLETTANAELQYGFLADSESGTCPCFNMGDVFEFQREAQRDDFLYIRSWLRDNERWPAARFSVCGGLGLHFLLRLCWVAGWSIWAEATALCGILDLAVRHERFLSLARRAI